MSLPATQQIASPARTDARIIGTHTEDMSGWTLEAVLKDAEGEVVSTITTDDAISISGNQAALDYTDGASYALEPARYRLYVRRTDTATRDLLAVIQWLVEDRDP